MKKRKQTTHTSIKNLHKLQKEWTEELQKRTAQLLGETPPNLARYEAQFLKNFKRESETVRNSNKKSLFQSITESNLILMGDFHSDPQSQRLLLRILRSLEPKRLQKTAVALEMFTTSHEPLLKRFNAGKMSPETLLKKTEYKENWGFSDRNVLPLLNFIRENKVTITGINRPKDHLPKNAFLKIHQKNEDLGARDEWAGARLLEMLSQDEASKKLKGKKPRTFERVIALIGELHLSDDHLPNAIRNLNRTGWVSELKMLRLFQNQDDLYWRVIKKTNPSHQSIFKLKSGDYCIFSSTPWNKARSYYHWLIGDPEQEYGIEFDELSHSQMQPLSKLFSLPLVKWDQFEWDELDGSDPLFWSGDWIYKDGLFYITNPSENISIEVGAVYTLLQLKNFKKKELTISDKIIIRAFGQFCSLLLNPKRKFEYYLDHVKRIKEIQSGKSKIKFPHEKWSRELYLEWRKKNSLPSAITAVFKKVPKPLREAVLETFCRYAGNEMAQILMNLFYEKKFELSDLLNLFETESKNKILSKHAKIRTLRKKGEIIKSKEDFL